MSFDATLQVRMDGELKAQVEELYRSLGTSFAEAVRIFAQQSLREGGMPFRPTLKEEINAKLSKSMEDIAADRVYSQAELDSRMRERFARGRHTAI